MTTRSKNYLRIHGHNYLLLHQFLDRLRAGLTVTEIAKEYDCTRQWIYLLMKTAEIDPLDFRWYRKKHLEASTRLVATLLASKHIKVRATGRKSLRVIEPGRSPINIAVHTATIPRSYVPNARTLYFHINLRRKGVAHVVPVNWGTVVFLKDVPEYAYIPNKDVGPRRWNYISIHQLANIEILDALRENVRV